MLTKPLGVGIITTALKGEVAEPDHVAAATDSMKRLNRQAAQCLQRIGVHARTDITGFALLGHAREMADKSEVQLRFHLDRLPFLDGAVDYAEQWLFPAGTCRNEQAYRHGIEFAATILEEMQQLLFTPETSGVAGLDPAGACPGAAGPLGRRSGSLLGCRRGSRGKWHPGAVDESAFAAAILAPWMPPPCPSPASRGGNMPPNSRNALGRPRWLTCFPSYTRMGS